MRKPECEEIVERFIEKLEQVEQYTIKLDSKKPRIYIMMEKKLTSVVLQHQNYGIV